MLRSYAVLRAQDVIFPPGSWFSPFSGRKGEAEHIVLCHRGRQPAQSCPERCLRARGDPVGTRSTRSPRARARGRTPTSAGMTCFWDEPQPILQTFFHVGGTASKEHKGADPAFAFSVLFCGTPAWQNRGWTQSLLLPGCRLMYTILFSTSTRKCYLTISIYLSHWSSKLQKCLESQPQRSSPLTTQWYVKKTIQGNNKSQ